MANVTPKFYKKEITDALAAESLKLALFTSAYTPNANTDELYSSLAGEVSSVGTGYTTGGIAVTAGKTSGYVDTTNARLDANDLSLASASFTARWGVLYNTSNSKIRGIYDFGGDKVVTTGTIAILWHSDGLLKVK